MATIPSTLFTPPPERDPRAPGAPFVVLDGVSWDTYESLLRDTAGRHVRMTYDEGTLVLMSPLPRHDKAKKLLGRFIETATFELDIPVSSFGSTTWRRQDLAKGLEPDECYYVRREPLVRGITDIDLQKHPAPDLAVEVDVWHHPLDRKRIYAALGVDELWTHDGLRTRFLSLRPDGTYADAAASGAIPPLLAEDVDRFLAMFGPLDENSVIREFRDWVRALPRR